MAYLRVDEQATYFDIYMDGVVARVWNNGSEAFIGKIYDKDAVGTTDLFSFGSKVVVGGTTYAISEDTGISVTMIENTPLRVVLRAQGNFEDSSQSDLSGEQDSVLYMIFYPDKIAMRIELNVTASITLSDNAINGLIFMDSVVGNLTNEDSKYESSSSEADAGGDGSQTSADYIATLSDECNVQGIMIDSSLGGGTGTYVQYIDDPGVALRFGWNNGTITADSVLEVMWIIDSAEREGSAKIYDSTDRLAMGDQYKDLEIDLTEGGSRVFDDGSHQYLEYDGAVLSDAPCTISGFIKTDDLSTSQFLLSIGDMTSYSRYISLNLVNNGSDMEVRANFRGAAANTYAPSSTYISLNTWHHIAGVYVSDTERYAYLDGGSKGSDTTDSGAVTGLNKTAIAALEYNPGRIYGISGKASHIAIWNVALTDAEVARLAAGALPTEIRPEALVAYWPLIDDDNDPIGGYNMTPYNSPTWSTTDYPDVFKPDKGTWEIQDILPAIIDESGFQSDGAWHIEVDANDEAKYTLDRTRIRPATVIHDWPFQYGSVDSPTSILLNHLKMDDNAANNTLTAEVGPDGSWHAVSDGSARNTDNDSVAADNFRGRALDTQDGTGYGQLAVGSGTVHDNDFLKKGSVLIKITPQYNYDDAAKQSVFVIAVSSTDWISTVYDKDNDKFFLDVKYNSGQNLISGGAYTDNYSLQRPHILLFSWDSDKDFSMMVIDGQVVATDVVTDTPTSSEPDKFYIGAWTTPTSESTDTIFDEIRTFSEAVLSYGAFFIGNGSGLLADIDNPHADLSWFFDGQAAAAKGSTDLGSDKNPTNSGGSFVTTDPLIGTNHWDANGATNVLTVAESSEDIVDYNNGFVAGWFNVQSFSGGEYLIDVRDADGSDRISAVLDASGNIDVTYRSQSTDEAITGDIAITAGKWFFLKITWDDNGGDTKVHSYINGQENGTPQTIANTWGGGTGLTWYFTEDYNGTNGCDAFIQTLWMGKKANVPEIWTAFGKPLHLPLVDKA